MPDFDVFNDFTTYGDGTKGVSFTPDYRPDLDYAHDPRGFAPPYSNLFLTPAPAFPQLPSSWSRARSAPRPPMPRPPMKLVPTFIAAPPARRPLDFLETVFGSGPGSTTDMLGFDNGVIGGYSGYAGLNHYDNYISQVGGSSWGEGGLMDANGPAPGLF